MLYINGFDNSQVLIRAVCSYCVLDSETRTCLGEWCYVGDGLERAFLWMGASPLIRQTHMSAWTTVINLLFSQS